MGSFDSIAESFHQAGDKDFKQDFFNSDYNIIDEEAPEGVSNDVEEKPASPPDPKVEAKVGETKTEEPTSQETSPEESGDKVESAPSKEAVPSVKALDGREYALSTTFTKKVDGQEREVSLKTLLDTYAGETALQARFSDANRMKQKAEHLQVTVAKELGQVKDTVGRFLVSVKNGHMRDAIDALCEISGDDPAQAWSMFEEARKSGIQQFLDLTDEERRELSMKEESSYWQRRATSKASRPSVASFEEQIRTKASNLGLSMDDAKVGYQILLDSKEKGEYNKEITIDAVIDEAQNFKIWRDIDETCREYLPDRVGDQNLYLQILQDTRQYGITKDQWISTIQEIQADHKKSVASKLEKQVEETRKLGPKQKATTPADTESFGQFDEEKAPLSWDDI